MTPRLSDRVLGLSGLALSAFYIWAASIIPDSFMADAVGPRTFPYIIGIGGILCSLAFILKPDLDPEWPSFGRLLEILAACVVMLAYAWALPLVGFMTATVIATTYLSWRLGSSPLGALSTGLGGAVGIYVIFHLILGLSLAEGPFGF